MNNAAKKATEQILAQKREDEQKIQAHESQKESGEVGFFDTILHTLKNKVVSKTLQQLTNEEKRAATAQQKKSKQELYTLQQQLGHKETREAEYTYKEGERETIDLWIEYLDVFLPTTTKEFLQESFETASWEDAMTFFLTSQNDTAMLMTLASYVLDDTSAINTLITIKDIHSQTLKNYTPNGRIKSRRKATFKALQKEWHTIVYPPAPAEIEAKALNQNLQQTPQAAQTQQAGNVQSNATVPGIQNNSNNMTSSGAGMGMGVYGSEAYTTYRRKHLHEFIPENPSERTYHHSITRKFVNKNAHLALYYEKEIPFSKISTIGKLFGREKGNGKGRWTLCSRNAVLEADRIFGYQFHRGNAFDAMAENPKQEESPGRKGSFYHSDYQRFHGKKNILMKKPDPWRTKEKQLGSDSDIVSWDGTSTPAGAEGSNLIDIYVTGNSAYGHRAMGFKANDGQWYVLDPYRRDKTGLPRPYSEYKKVVEQGGTTIARINFHEAEKSAVMDV